MKDKEYFEFEFILHPSTLQLFTLYLQPPMPLSLLQVLQKATEFLKKHEVEQARLHAEYLLAYLLKAPRLELYLQFERVLTEEVLTPYRELLKKRSRGIPLQHLLGSSEFFGRTFLSDARALIPRPETEQLVERGLTHQATRALEVGTGSGAIAITLALEKPTVFIEAIDLSQEALALAQENAAHHQVSNITWHHGSLLEPLSRQSPKPLFDLIVANLPYIPTEEIPTLDREVQQDPKMALDGGHDGLALIRKLIAQAHEYLLPEGKLLLEIGHGQAEAVLHCFQEHNYRDIETFPDYQGVLRFAEGRHP